MRTTGAGVAAIFILLLSSCGYGNDEPSAAGRPDFPHATVLIETDDGSKLLEVEVAETHEQKVYGLMFRKSLPADSGMVFVYFEPTWGGFWMKNTLIPLSIAFFDADGKIVRILDMEPCRKEACPIYNPGAEYMGALEVNQGAFERWGVAEGDVIHLRR